MGSFEKIENGGGEILAILVRKGTQNDKLNFITPDEFPLQVGIHNQEEGVIINAHKHRQYNKEPMKIEAQEFFYVESGKMQIDIYDINDTLFKSVILDEGDLILLNSGHGVKFLEKTKMLEVKQGPYRGIDNEKVFIGDN